MATSHSKGSSIFFRNYLKILKSSEHKVEIFKQAISILEINGLLQVFGRMFLSTTPIWKQVF
jgi:hypothetical protein